MDIITQILLFLLGFFIGRFLLTLWSVRKTVIAVEEAHIAKLAESVHVVKQEVINDIMYWFDNDDGTFLAQGRDHEEIIAVLRNRFPRHIFVLNQNQMIVGPDFDRVVDFELNSR